MLFSDNTAGWGRIRWSPHPPSLCQGPTRCGLDRGGVRRIAIVQSCLCNLTQRSQSILWKLHVAVDNTPRQKAMQHHKAGRMAAHTVLLPYQGGVEGGDSKNSPKTCPTSSTALAQCLG